MNEVSNKDSYNKIALQWTGERHENSFVTKLIIEFANKVKAGGTILDIGCGSGYPNAVYLCNKGFKLRDIDASEEMIRIAKAQKTHNASFEVCDAFEYKPVGTFDGIPAWDSLFHLSYKQQDVIYKKIASWLNDGGWFYFPIVALKVNLSGGNVW